MEIEAVNNVINHEAEWDGFRGSLNLETFHVLNTNAVHFGAGPIPKWSELEPHVARARAEAKCAFQVTRNLQKSKAANVATPKSVSPSQAARAWDVSPKP